MASLLLTSITGEIEITAIDKESLRYGYGWPEGIVAIVRVIFNIK